MQGACVWLGQRKEGRVCRPRPGTPAPSATFPLWPLVPSGRWVLETSEQGCVPSVISRPLLRVAVGKELCVFL